MKIVKYFFGAILLSARALAADTPNLNNLTLADFDKIAKEFSANQNFYSVSGARSLGTIFGFELGLAAGITRTDEINNVSKRLSPTSASVDMFPHAAALGRFSVPFGITVEGIYFPKKSIKDVTYDQWGLAGQWTLTDVFFTDWPLSLALKGYYTSTDLSFKTTVQNSSTANIPVQVTAKFATSVWGLQTIASREFFGFLEPFVGLGYAKGASTISLDGSATATFFNVTESITAGSAVTSKPKSIGGMAGLNAQLFFFVLGAQYDRVFGTDVYTGKFSFRF